MTESQAIPPEFLTVEEVAEIDKALLTAREKFTARVALYSLRSLKLIAANTGTAIADFNSKQIALWVEQDPSLSPEQGFDSNFKQFFSQLVISSLRPLKQIALEDNVAIEQVTTPQVIAWFEKEAKIRIEQGNEATFLG
jgi:hypothetical protein